jgi:hypothetical protein
MKIQISFPEQDIQVVDALPNVVEHYAKHDWDLPFIRVVEGMPATLWSRRMKDENGKEFWEFNHIEDRHCENDIPTPKHPSHSSVWNGKWKKEFVTLNTNPITGYTKVIRS